MNQEVKYTGFTAVPSDYDAADGQLAVAINVVPEDNELKPVFQPHLVLDLKCDPTSNTDADGVTTTQKFSKPHVVYIHKTASIEHLIVLVTVDTTVGNANATREHALYWLDRDATEAVYEDKNKICAVTGFNHVNAIGNTLMIFAEGSIQYVLWKKPEYDKKDAYYLYLGDHIPHVQLSFGLVGEVISANTWKEEGSDDTQKFIVDFDETSFTKLMLGTYSSTVASQITADVMAYVNKTIASFSTNNGKFCFPFFVRYALRLFDGSLVYHSAPVLMSPCTGPAPLVSFASQTGKVSSIHVTVTMVASSLDYAPIRTPELTSLKNWTDIVTGIEVFVSKPIYTFNQGGTIRGCSNKKNFAGKYVGKLHLSINDRTDKDAYGEWNYKSFLPATHDSLFNLPEFDEEETFTENVKNNANFYKLYTIELEDFLKTDWQSDGYRKPVPVEDDYLQSLVAREVMTDDYLTNDRLHADYSFGYNSRMNIAGVKRQPFGGFCPSALFAYCNAEIGEEALDVYTSGDIAGDGTDTSLSYFKTTFTDTHPYKIVTYINEDSLGVTATSDVETDTLLLPWGNTTEKKTNTFSYGCWLFYPNVNAYKMEIYCAVSEYIAESSTSEYATKRTTNLKYTVKLKPHDFLNGAYAFLGYERDDVPTEIVTEADEQIPFASIPKKIRDTFLTTVTGNTSSDTSSSSSSTSSSSSSSSTTIKAGTSEITIESTDDPPTEFQPYQPESDGDGMQTGLESSTYNSSTVLATASLTTSTSYPINVSNKVYSSEVNNPFYFPLNGINTIGSGEIRGLCSAAKALSQGQFGQFPLYAFTTDGVWALEVSSTGTFSAKQPITRDVCLSTDGITQLDSAVLFPSDRGLMVLSGSQAVCISDSINSEYPFNALDLPAFSKLHDMLGHDPLTDFCLPTKPFREFLTDCRMIYDYVHQRVLVYVPGITYAYVYSLKSTQWGMTFSTIASDVNSYPEALANNNDSELVNFSERITKTDGSSTPVLYVTRPLKFAGADVLKTVDNVIQRGFFQKGHIATALYGSRDLIHWHLVWTSKDHYLRGFRGTPYKYFRIAGVGSLDDDESISGASVQLDGRLTNQPR